MYIYIYKDEYDSNNEAREKTQMMKLEQRVLLSTENVTTGMNAYWHYLVAAWTKGQMRHR